MPGTSRAWIAAAAVVVAQASVGCGDSDGSEGLRSAGDTVAPAAGASGNAGMPAVAGTGATGNPGQVPGSSAGAAAQAGTGGAGAMAPPGMQEDPPVTLPASCAEAQDPYEIVVTPLDAAFVPAEADRSWGGAQARVPVAVNAEGQVYVGFTREDGGSRNVAIVRPDSTAGDALSIDGAVVAGIAATSDGVGALLFDPNPDVDARTWVAVARLASDGAVRFQTDLFRSSNLEDVDTKGGASAGRIGYVAESDTLVAYFGHTQRYDDGVRHQGGYLATLDAAGVQSVASGWFGSHNLQQRLLIDGARIAVLGLGDAFPKGIFFNYVGEQRLRPRVIYALAADGVGTTNGQLGGMVDLGAEIAVPFITNRSVAQDLDAGEWPDIDESISMQIREAAAAGTDLGLLRVPKSGLPEGDLPPAWLDAQPTAGARMASLKSASYGPLLVLLAWAELTGSNRNPAASYYTMVIDAEGNVCQPKTELPANQGFAAGDELVAAPDGSIVWANVDAGRIQLLRLVP